MKYCKDCKHFVDFGIYFSPKINAGCLHPALMEKDVVWGPKASKPHRNRSTPENLCGPDGKLFEQKLEIVADPRWAFWKWR